MRVFANTQYGTYSIQAYANELQWRIVWKHLFLKIDAEDIARIMYVSPRSVYRYTAQFLVTVDVKPFIKRNGPTRELCDYEEYFLVHLVLSKPGIYLREIQEELYSSTMHWIDMSTICRTLHRLGMTYQKIKHFSITGVRMTILGRNLFF